MDTRFWGPSGWRLLHLIAAAAEDLPADPLHTFFVTLPYALPCKFCRASLSDYIQNDPVPRVKSEYAHWMYRIHNRVNAKLRDQHLNELPDPRWSEIKQRYSEHYKAPCTQNSFLGWDFLYSTAYTTPCPAVISAPMPNAPPAHTIPTPELRNRWGVMSRTERIPLLEAWWTALGHVLPFERWRAAWASGTKRPHTRNGRGHLTRWLFKMEAHMCSTLNADKHHESYYAVCSELNTFSSNCGKLSKKVKVKTCRAKQSTARTTLKRRRSKIHTQTGGFL